MVFERDIYVGLLEEYLNKQKYAQDEQVNKDNEKYIQEFISKKKR